MPSCLVVVPVFFAVDEVDLAAGAAGFFAGGVWLGVADVCATAFPSSIAPAAKKARITNKGFLMVLLSHCRKNSANQWANHTHPPRHHQTYADSGVQHARSELFDCYIVPAVSGSFRPVCIHEECRPPKLVAHANTKRFTDTRIYSDAQRHANRYSKGSNTNHSEPHADSKFNCYADCNSNALARIFKRPGRRRNTDANADTRIYRFRIIVFPKQNPPVFLAGLVICSS